MTLYIENKNAISCFYPQILGGFFLIFLKLKLNYPYQVRLPPSSSIITTFETIYRDYYMGDSEYDFYSRVMNISVARKCYGRVKFGNLERHPSS